MKDLNKELGDIQLEWKNLQDAFKKGIFEVMPEFLKLFKNVGEAIDVSTKGIADLFSEVCDGFVDGINNSRNINPVIKEKVGKVIENGIKIINKGIAEVQAAENVIKDKINILEDVGKSINNGLSDIDRAKAE